MSNLITPLTPQQTVVAQTRASQEGYIHRVLVAFDQFWNVAGTDGLPDETISAHTQRVVADPDAKHKLLAKVLDHLLNVVQPQHGEKAEVGDAVRAQKVLITEDSSGGFQK